jgi:hypothetical protein
MRNTTVFPINPKNMQTIFNAGTQQLPPIPNKTYIRTELIDGSIFIPSESLRLLTYMLGRESDWILDIEQIKHDIGFSAYKVKRALKWLQNAGYVRHERKKKGLPQWFVYDIAQKTDKDIDKNTQ